MQWLELAQNEIQSGLFMARAIAKFGYPGDFPEAQAKAAIALRTLEWRLGGHRWLVGSAPTLADIACFPYVALAGQGGIDVSPYAGVASWIRAFRSIDGFIAMPGL